MLIGLPRLVETEMWRGSTDLLQFFDDHGEGFKDGGGRSRQGDDPFWTVPL